MPFCRVTSSSGRGRIVGDGSGRGIISGGHLEVAGLDLDGAGGLRAGGRLGATDVTVAGAVDRCVSGDRVRVRGVTCTDCGGEGIVGRRLRGEDLVVSGCRGAGIDAFFGSARLLRVAVTGNGWAPEPGGGSAGVAAHKVVLVDSTVTGNFAGPLLAPTITPMDVFASRRPRLSGTSCTRSGTYGNWHTPWGVCGGD